MIKLLQPLKMIQFSMIILLNVDKKMLKKIQSKWTSILKTNILITQIFMLVVIHIKIANGMFLENFITQFRIEKTDKNKHIWALI